ncbi:MAG: N-acetyltransferase family protein [bacterium]
MSYHLEPMSEAHRHPVIDIFNHFIIKSFASYLDAPVPYDFFDRFLHMSRGYPSVVIKDEADAVIGFAFLHPYHPASTFKRTAEISYFILPEHTGKGLGRRVLDSFIEKSRALGIDSILASISSLNEQSLSFHRKNGFRECGRFVNVGRKSGESFDVVWMQMML